MDELEKLYQDEQVTRKRLFNVMEDMKSKIRVYCRWVKRYRHDCEND